MKKLLYAFLIAAVAAVHSGCKDDEETFVHVEKVSIDVRELHLNPGKTYQLSVTIEPADATNRRIAWYSSNTNVATVDKSGLVTALAFGEVTLTAEANDMHVNDAIRLTIDDVDNSIPIESLTLDATSKTFDFAADPGVGAFRFAPAILPENATNKKLKWTSDDPLVAGWFDSGWNIVRNENEIIVPHHTRIRRTRREQTAERTIRRPDRVMVKEGRAVVVDYKFGLRENPDHRRQLGEYIELLREIGYTQVEGYLWYVRMERIVSIDG